jgi:DNA polymerase III epsilon subunit-like protein
MLSFDIETTGLNKKKDRITVASVYDPDRNIKKSFNFMLDDRDSNISEFLAHLDDAVYLCAFNGVRFDIPFIVHHFSVERERYTKWFLKIFDYFEICKLGFSSSCSLNKLLEANGEEIKISNGMQAVIWANEGKWKLLEDYCMMDTILTHKISTRKLVILPLNGKKSINCTHMLDSNTMMFYE